MAEIYVNDQWQGASETEIKRALREDRASTRLRAKERSRSVVEARAAALANGRSAQAERAHVAAVRRIQFDLGLIAPSRDFGPRIRMRHAQRRNGKQRDLGVRITKSKRKAVPQIRAIRPKKPIIDARGRESVFVRFRYLGLKTPGWRPGRAGEHARYVCGEDAKLGVRIITNMGDTLDEVVEAWNCIERIEIGARKNAKVQQRIVIHLPAELSDDEQRQFVQEYCEREFGRLGLPYSASVHTDPRGCNAHAHIDHSNRPFVRNGAFDWTFAAEKVNGLDSKQGLRAMRARIAGALNIALHKAGSERRYTHQTYAERGIAAHRQEHLGQQRAAAVRMGETVAMAERNASRAYANEAAYSVYCEQLKVDAAEQEVRHLATDQRDRQDLRQAIEGAQPLHNLGADNAFAVATAALQATTSGEQAKLDSTTLVDARAQAKTLKDSAMAIASLGSETNLEGTVLSDSDRRAFWLSRDLSDLVPLIKQIAAADVEVSSMQDRLREEERYDAALQKLGEVLEAKRIAATGASRANVALTNQQTVKTQAVPQKANRHVPQPATGIAPPSLSTSGIKLSRPLEAAKQHLHQGKPDPAPTLADPLSAPRKLDDASQNRERVATPEVLPDLNVRTSKLPSEQEATPPIPKHEPGIVGMWGAAVIHALSSSVPPTPESLIFASKLFDEWQMQDAEILNRYIEAMFDLTPAGCDMHRWMTLHKQTEGADKELETAEFAKQLLANDALMIRIRAETPLLELLLFRQLQRHSIEHSSARGSHDVGAKHDMIEPQQPSEDSPATVSKAHSNNVTHPVPAEAGIKQTHTVSPYQDVVHRALLERTLSDICWLESNGKRSLLLSDASAKRLGVPTHIEIAPDIIPVFEKINAAAGHEQFRLSKFIEGSKLKVRFTSTGIMLPADADQELQDIAAKHSRDPEVCKVYASIQKLADEWDEAILRFNLLRGRRNVRVEILQLAKRILEDDAAMARVRISGPMLEVELLTTRQYFSAQASEPQENAGLRDNQTQLRNVRKQVDAGPSKQSLEAQLAPIHEAATSHNELVRAWAKAKLLGDKNIIQQKAQLVRNNDDAERVARALDPSIMKAIISDAPNRHICDVPNVSVRSLGIIWDRDFGIEPD